LLNGSSGELVAGSWRFSWRGEPAPERLERNQSSSWFEPGSYLVRPWRAGDMLRPLGGTGRRLVVRCMQEARIARSQRAAWPVLEAGGRIVWVPGVSRSAHRVPAPGEPAVRIDVHSA
jgi:tRNA(Ile)-lysidine synthase